MTGCPDYPTLAYWLGLAKTPTIGTKRFATLLEHFPDPKEIFELSPNLLNKLNLPKAVREHLLNPDWDAVELDLKWAEKPNHHIVTLADEAYPV